MGVSASPGSLFSCSWIHFILGRLNCRVELTELTRVLSKTAIQHWGFLPAHSGAVPAFLPGLFAALQAELHLGGAEPLGFAAEAAGKILISFQPVPGRARC